MAQELLCDVEFEESPIPDGTIHRLDEVTIKRDGCIWRIYKSDTDSFPSNRHAINIESGLKLNLSDGALFLGTRPTGKSISRKHLEFIRTKAEAKGVTLPVFAL